MDEPNAPIRRRGEKGAGMSSKKILRTLTEWFEYGRQAFLKPDGVEAVRAMEHVIDRHPAYRHPDGDNPYFYLGKINEVEGREDAAIGHYTRALAVDAQDEESRIGRASCYTVTRSDGPSPISPFCSGSPKTAAPSRANICSMSSPKPPAAWATGARPFITVNRPWRQPPGTGCTGSFSRPSPKKSTVNRQNGCRSGTVRGSAGGLRAVRERPDKRPADADRIRTCRIR